MKIENSNHPISTINVLDEVMTERGAQEIKWGIQNHDALKWNAILVEEVGEVSKAILEADKAGYRAELVQLAAVAVAIESLDRTQLLREQQIEYRKYNAVGTEALRDDTADENNF